MKEKNINGSELSRLSGVGKADISNYLNDKYMPKQDKVYMMAKAMNVNPGWLMTGVEQKKAEQKEIIVPNSELFAKLCTGMSALDYEVMMDILERTEIAMRERGEL